MKRITKNTLKKLSCNTLTSTALISNLILNPALAIEYPMTPAQKAFRNAFISGMPKEASEKQRMDLLYPITPANHVLSNNIQNGENEVSFFDRLRSSIPIPTVFSDQSKIANFDTLSDSVITTQIGSLNNEKELPLIILAPGIFGEFIVAHPFQDVLDDNKGIENASTYKRDFLSKLKQAEGSDLEKYSTDLRLELSQTTFAGYLEAKLQQSADDRKNSLYNLGREQTDLSKLVLVGALKNENGEIVANTLTLDTKALSLESLGALRSNATMFNRRLSKFFKIMGHIPKNIILEGYSRGTPVALDMLALGSEKECSDFADEASDTFLEHGCLSLDGQVSNWTKNVKSFLSVAGVIYGSEIADQGFGFPVKSDPNAEVVATNNSEDFKVYKQVQALKKLVNISQVGSLLDSKGFINKAILNTESIDLKQAKEILKKILKNDFSELNKVFGNFFETVENSGILLMPNLKEFTLVKQNNNIYNAMVSYVAYSNTKKWIEFLITMAEIQAPDISKNLTDILNEIKKHPLDYNALNAQYKKIKEQQEKLLVTYQINRRINLNEAVVQGINLLKSAFGDANYNNNILQFATLAKETIDAAKDLTSKSRFDWWKSHTIPTDGIKYYSVSATMKEDDNITISDKPENVAFYSYNSKTPDFQSLKDGFETFLKIGDFYINDSQVTILKSSFFPQIASQLNRNQQPYKAESLGLFHTHHWGLTLMAVTKVRDDNTAAKKVDPNFNTSIEPFPRKALLRATLAAIAEDTNR